MNILDADVFEEQYIIPWTLLISKLRTYLHYEGGTVTCWWMWMQARLGLAAGCHSNHSWQQNSMAACVHSNHMP